MRIAIDSGGTFTDCLVVRENELHIIKVASRPGAPAEAIAEAVQLALAQSREQLGELDLVCGTTVGTNALLEKRGGRVALVTTAGFEDVLEIGRQARPRLYDLFAQKSAPLVAASLRLGVKERLAADGSIIQGLTANEIVRVTRAVRKIQPDSVALCFLFSFRNAKHENQIAAALRAAGFDVSVSSEILPEYREYERTSTVVINAYLVPVMSGYLRDISTRISKLTRSRTNAQKRTTPPARVRIMQSNGGIISAEQAAREPVRTILSGPAGGVIGAAQAAKLAGLEKCISFDMGGTSTDVALLTEDLHTTSEAMVAGFPVAVPMLEIHTVGAGGGSIARFDAGGALRVGPESAGAEPGPICYGRGTKPTVTDAHAVLGHLGTAGLLGGTFSLDVPRARSMMREEIKSSGGRFRSVEAFAQGIISVANSVMEKAIRVISIERGHDPRDYSLVAFGGAGGLHACDLAAALEMRGVLIPVFPGGLSALGILRANVVKEFSRTVLLPAQEVAEEPSQLKKLFGLLEVEAARALRAEGFDRQSRRFHFSLDMRYLGQAYELNIAAWKNIVGSFHQAHQQRYGYQNKSAKVEIVNVRCRATGVTEQLPPAKIARRSGSRRIPAETVSLVFGGRRQQASVYQRDDLRAGDNFHGPGIVLEYSATTVIPLRWRARVDDYGQLLLTPRRTGQKN
jgi:N-methylhydantoinase A